MWHFILFLLGRENSQDNWNIHIYIYNNNALIFMFVTVQYLVPDKSSTVASIDRIVSIHNIR